MGRGGPAGGGRGFEGMRARGRGGGLVGADHAPVDGASVAAAKADGGGGAADTVGGGDGNTELGEGQHLGAYPGTRAAARSSARASEHAREHTDNRTTSK